MWRQEKTNPVLLLGIGIIGTIYLVYFNFFIIPLLNFEPALGWINAIVGAIGLGLLTYALPNQSDIYLSILLITLLITCALISGRRPSYFLLFFTTVLTLIIRRGFIKELSGLTLQLSLAIIAVIIVETIMQLKNHRAIISKDWKPSPISAARLPPRFKQSR